MNTAVNSINKSPSALVHEKRDATIATINKNLFDSINILSELLKHSDVLGKETSEIIDGTVKKTTERLNRDAFYVAIVGEMKAGKSTFLNAILGAPVLSTAKRESTATVTYIKKSEKINYSVILETGEKKAFLDKEKPEIDRIFSEVLTYLQELRNYSLPDRLTDFDEEKFMPVADCGAYVPLDSIMAKLKSYSPQGKETIAMEAATAIIPSILLKRKTPWYLKIIQMVVAFFYRKHLLAYHDARVKWLNFFFDDAIVRLKTLYSNRLSRFFSEVQDFTDMNKLGNQVIQLDIDFPALRLPSNIVLMDTPGVNTSSEQNEKRAWHAIRESADGCLLVSSIGQAVSESTKTFLRDVKEVVPHVLLVLTKVDELLESSFDDDDMDIYSQLEEARRIGATRFAKEVGRSPKDIFSIAVAARVALQGGKDEHNLCDKFDKDLATLFDLLSSERAMAVCAHSAVTINNTIDQVNRYHASAKQAYQSKLNALHSQRLPEKKDFIIKSLMAEEENIAAVSDVIAEELTYVVDEAFKSQVKNWKEKIYKCESKAEVKELINKASTLMQVSLKEVDNEIQANIAKKIAQESISIEVRLAEGLRDKYRIVDEISGVKKITDVRKILEVTNSFSSTNVESDMNTIVGDYQGAQFAMGAGGAAIGAAIGTFIAPGIGTALGAGIGALLGLFSSLDSIKADCIKKIEEILDGSKCSMTEAVRNSSGSIADIIRASITQWFTNAVDNFQKHIDELINMQNLEFKRVQENLKHLLDSVDKLQKYGTTTDRLAKELAEMSQGLCISV